MKYIKNFETESLYQAAQATLDKPNVSLIEATMGLNYLPYVTPVVQQHDYVEIAGIKWATMNIGANSVTDTGLYFQWGDTQGYTAAQIGDGEGQKYFGWADYKYGNSISTAEMTKYNTTDGLITLESTDDAVKAAWGGNWRMPTASECIELSEAVTTAWTNDYQGSGVAGLICTDKTDSSKTLFFPAAGHATQGNIYNLGEIGYHWSSSIDPDYGYGHALYLTLSSSYNALAYAIDSRYFGYTIRGVLADN